MTNYIVFMLVIKCAVRTGGGRENVILLEVSEEPQVGAYPPHENIQKSVDKMTFVVPSVALKKHCPGKTGYTQTS